ncbi:flagellar hook-basal body complex protein FliE [Desulfocucumis palustris]|uniref:Flagellar hook-basal body complex protein FliE n=1 Tax=Desulfocucumis palustris TaxID=1898651 RepID=A0A2L2XA92_9FIRM|nr:flagellar hook-basal body complex protein FliE [Desulfocucumis palustris]GBF33187.1 flagellar hook-basal body complex protein FliE [Desulfocucumis palustris]
MQIAPLPLILPQVQPDVQGPEASGETAGASFGQMLNKALQDVNKSQINANETIKGFLTGEVQEVHQVTIAMEQAKIMLLLATEVRNKVIEAYQEISRMQV